MRNFRLCLLALASGVALAACGESPELLEWEPVGCYAFARGPSSRWISELRFKPVQFAGNEPPIRVALVQNAGELRDWDGDLRFEPLAADSPAQNASWSRDGATIVRLNWRDVHALFQWTLVSFRADTIDGYIRRDEAFAPRKRVRGVRAACVDTIFQRTASGLQYNVLRRGNGDTAKAGMRATIHETTTLVNGTVVFDSYASNTPITFLLGGNQVIKGVEEGVNGMRVGEKRRLLVPPSLSARSSYPPNTPPDSTLQIDVELISVKRP